MEIAGGSDLGESAAKCASMINTDNANSTSSLSMGPPNRPGDVRVCVFEGVVTLKRGKEFSIYYMGNFSIIY